MKKKKKGKYIVFLISFFFAVFLILFYYLKVVLPIVKTYIAAEAKSITERSVNLAVSNVINRTLSYDALIDITYNSSGEIVSFSANQYEINSITREIIKETQYQMQNLGGDNLIINFGTFTGMPFLVGKGSFKTNANWNC